MYTIWFSSNNEILRVDAPSLIVARILWDALSKEFHMESMRP